MIAAGQAPAGLRITSKTIRWPESVIRRWQQSLSDDPPIKVEFSTSCPPYNEGEGAAFAVRDCAKLLALNLVSLVDPADLGRLSADLSNLYAARKEAELRGKQFLVHVAGQWRTADRIYGEFDDGNDEGGDDTPDEPKPDSGGDRQLDPVNRLLRHYEKEGHRFVDNLIASDLAKEREQATVEPQPILNEAPESDGSGGDDVLAETPYEVWAREEQKRVHEILDEQARFFGVEPALNQSQD